MDSSNKIKFPFEIKDVEPEINAELLKYFKGERTGFVQVGPENYFFPHKYKAEAESYYNFEARPSDIWVATFPRSGTTWTQELVWLIANNLDFNAAKSQRLTERFPFFEFPLFVHPHIKADLLTENSNNVEKLKFIENISRPGYKSLSEVDVKYRRFIKTHFPFSLLPPSVMAQKCKIVYVARNPKDVAISYYHLNRLFRTQGYIGDFERYWEYFERGLNAWMPYFSHINEALVHRNDSNVLFLNYENILSDLRGAVYEIANFLNCKLTDEGIQKLIEHLNIENFRMNPSVNMHEMRDIGLLNEGEASFIRLGGRKSGAQSEFAANPPLLARANGWIQNNQTNVF